MENTFLSFIDFLAIQEYVTEEEKNFNSKYFLPLYDLYQDEYEAYCDKHDYEYEEID